MTAPDLVYLDHLLATDGQPGEGTVYLLHFNEPIGNPANPPGSGPALHRLGARRPRPDRHPHHWQPPRRRDRARRPGPRDRVPDRRPLAGRPAIRTPPQAPPRHPQVLPGLPPVGRRRTLMADTPDLDTLQEWMSDGGCEATDGCWVEPDGTCEHGEPSWRLKLGYV
jgi:hypothetical protein